MSRPLITVFGSFLWLALASADEPPGSDYAKVAAPKHGVVIDDTSGKPIADATIVVFYDHSVFDLGGTRGGCIATRFATTASDGSFSISSGAMDAVLPVGSGKTQGPVQNIALQAKEQFGWRLLIFKGDYVEKSDEKALVNNMTYGYQFSWQVDPPPEQSIGGSAQLAPIRMVKSSIGGQGRVIYFSQMIKSIEQCKNGRAGDDAAKEQDHRFQEEVLSLISPIPCSSPENEVYSKQAVGSFYSAHVPHALSGDPFYASGRGREDTFYSRMEQSASYGAANFHESTAGVLCWAQKGRETPP